MLALQLTSGGGGPGGHDGEVAACTYTPDGKFVLSGGWDGHLRLWEAGRGAHVTGFRVSEKPVSAVAVSPDGKEWLSGTLEGMLARWDALTQRRLSVTLAHTRPISAIVHGPDGLVTASWDRSLIVWNPADDRDRRALTGHRDIVAGCRHTPNGRSLLSWSYDGTLCLWDLARATATTRFVNHTDRVLCGAVSPDGRWALSGSRDSTLRLWDLKSGREAMAVTLGSEVRGCFFLPDGETVGSVEVHGNVSLHAVPELNTLADLGTRLPITCAALAPAGDQVAVGCEDGRVYRVQIDGLAEVPLIATATRTSRRTQTKLERLLGKSKVVQAYQCTCPACRQSFELPGADPARPAPCPHCQRKLKVSSLSAHG